MSILPVGIGPQEGGYQIERSLRFNSADSAYLDRSVSTSGDLRKWTVSCWVKRGTLSGSADRYLFTQTNEDGSGADIKYTIMRFTTADKLELADRWASAGDEKITTTAVFRDPSAWYHVVFVRDSDNATAADRAIIYVNGVRQDVTGSFTQSKDSSWNKQTTASYGQEVSGRFRFAGSWYYGSDFYLSEVHSIDGQALDPTSFGEYNSDTGVWQPKAYTGSYGTNGFYLDFADNSSTTALGYDAAGSNDWTPNNFSVTAGSGNDSLVDTPTPYGTDTGAGGEVRGNYATLNPLDKGSAVTLSNGNLSMASSNASYSWLARSTIALPSSGKWYWEVDLTGGTIVGHAAGIYTGDFPTQTSGWVSSTGNSYQVGFGYIYSYIQYQSGSASFANWGTNTNAVTGDRLMFAYDADNQALWVGRNGTWYNTSGTANPSTNTDPRWTSVPSGMFPGFNAANPTGDCAVFNFGQRPFAYAAPTGFKALCTTNLPDPAIADGSTAMNVVTYTGTGSTRSVTGVGFQPDFTWLKERSNVRNHYLYDVVRGPLKELYSNLTSAESSNTIGLSAFDSDGFTINSGDNAFNGTGNSYVAWNWKAGGTGVSNTAGTITSTVSANPTAGFSIVTYAGVDTPSTNTVGHGLGVAPVMWIIKNRTNTSPLGWIVNTTVIDGSVDYLVLNTTSAKADQGSPWSTPPTSTVFTLGANDGNTCDAGSNYVAYCFAPIAGYSAFGSYTGNGSTDGPFIYTGFRPKFILVKSSSNAFDWHITDTSRSPYNQADTVLFPNSSAAETNGGGYYYDLLSNGFKCRNLGAATNGNGYTYIYMAFAENPFSLSLAR